MRRVTVIVLVVLALCSVASSAMAGLFDPGPTAYSMRSKP